MSAPAGSYALHCGIACFGIAVTAVLPTAQAAQERSGPATLEQLEQRRIDIRRTEPAAADAETLRDNYRELLRLTRDPVERHRILRRLAKAELTVALDSGDPRPGARRALELYRRLLRSDYREREAELLYRTAHAADLAGEASAGIEMLDRLIEQYPEFERMAEARFRRAELRFVDGRYQSAIRDYNWLVERGEDTDFHLQSLYKRGWARYKLADHRGALEDELAMLRRLLGPERFNALGEFDTEGLTHAQRELVEDAIRNMTLNFAQLGKEYTPADFVDDVDAPRFEYALSRSLIDHYLDKDRFTDASESALAFARRHPQHPEAKALEVEAIAALETGGFDVPALEAKQAYVERYTSGERKATPEIRDRIREYLDQIVTSLHAGAQKTGLAVDYRAAAEWYEKYLQAFPEAERSAELAFLRGEALYEAERYAEAARAYERAAYDMPANDRSAEAAYAALLAHRKAAGDEAPTNEAVRTATLRFVQAHPSHPQATAALAKLAEDLYQAEKLELAAKVADKVIAHEPAAKPPQLANAWRIRGAAAMAAGKHAEAEKAASWILDNVQRARDEDVQYRQLATAVYRQGEQLAEKGEDAAAIEQFLRLREQVPPGNAEDVRAIALYDAAAASVRLEDSRRALELLARFRDRYPEHELVPETTRKLAELYLQVDDKAQAAREFARVRGQSDLAPAARSEAARQTARLRAETGDSKGAIAAYKLYLQDFDPEFEQAIEAHHRLVRLYQEDGRTDEADAWRRKLIAAEEEAGPARTNRSRTLAARAALELATRHRTAFAKAKLALPLEKSLPAKKTRLEKALDAYARAADYDIAEVTTAATYYTGDLYYDFSQALLNSPRPAELSEQELAQYEVLLEEQAFPFEEEAIGIHEANVERIAKGVYDGWVRKSLAQLAELVPARYSRRERLGDGIVMLQ